MSMEPWSQDLLKTAIDMWEAGKSAGEIANSIKRSRSAVCGMMNRLRMKGHEFNRQSIPSADRVATSRQRTSQPVSRRVRRFVPLPPVPTFVERPPAVLTVTLDISNKRPWLERKPGQCAAPVEGEGADTISCCAPAEDIYCIAHLQMFKVPLKPRDARNLQRLAA